MKSQPLSLRTIRMAIVPFLLHASGSVYGEEDALRLPPREFRAAWVATVANIDWPSEPGLSSERQQEEFERIVQRARELHLNALILQVRPACDALYESEREPWSPYLTGKMGKPPEPYYDPLRFAIDCAHRHGLELHVWFNPYRALHKSFQGKPSADHIAQTHPDAVCAYDGYLWLDPGNEQAVQHSLDVMLDVVKRYDIDGIHMDDYFYPYPVNDAEGAEVPFPDEESFARARASGFEGTRADWRRENVDRLVATLYYQTKARKPWVLVGISPFGIWRPGHPESIKGFDAYDRLYADARKWLQQGWVDYLTPQLYWKIASDGQSYPRLLQWWVEQNTQDRYIWPGNFASRVGMDGARAWDVEEITAQIATTREQAGATGNVLFSMKSLFPDYGPLGDALLAGPYHQPALIPIRRDAREGRPQPQVQLTDGEGTRRATLVDGADARLWVTWSAAEGAPKIVPGSSSLSVDGLFAIAAVDRLGTMSAPVILLDSP